MDYQNLCQPEPGPKVIEDKKFIKIIETAILQSLLEKGQLARWQFDLCLEKLN